MSSYKRCEVVQQSRRASGIIGAITLLLGSSWVFGELVSAFNIIWGLQRPRAAGRCNSCVRRFFRSRWYWRRLSCYLYR
jgi:uncharacterized BrkB/YihY/UPF0761 family membrane protein